MRGGAIRPCSGFPSTGSSLGAMIGSRSGRLAEAWPRRFCITRLVIVIRLTGACEAVWGIRDRRLYKCTSGWDRNLRGLLGCAIWGMQRSRRGKSITN